MYPYVKDSGGRSTSDSLSVFGNETDIRRQVLGCIELSSE